MPLPFKPKFNPVYIPIVIIGLGIFLRCNVYLQNRSLIIDEANLARNICEKEYSGFLSALDYEQYAPPLFSAATKVLTQIAGVNEFALRLIPFLGGCAVLILLFFIGKILIREKVGLWYAMLLLSFSVIAIRYSSEFKQYATDAAITLGFIFWAIQFKNRPLTRFDFIKWSVVGAISVWCSMPSVFMLAAVGLAFLYKSWRLKEKQLIPIILMASSWLLSFGVYFYLILYSDARSDYLANYHADYFFSFLPADTDTAIQSMKLLRSLFRNATDQTILSISWAIGVFALGLFSLVRKEKFLALLLFMPILFCLMASHLQLYSLIPRLTLFFIPLMMLIMGRGVSYLWHKSNIPVKILLGLIMLITVINTEGYTYFVNRMEFEDSKSVMKYLQSHGAEDEFIYVQHDGVPAFVFYNEMHDQAFQFEHFYLAHWRDHLPAVVTEELSTSDDTAFWLFLSHTFPQSHIDQYIRLSSEIGHEDDRFISTQASAYRFKVK